MSEVIKSDDENSWDFLDLLNSPKPSEYPKAFNWMSDKQNKAPSNPTQIKKERKDANSKNEKEPGEFNDLNNSSQSNKSKKPLLGKKRKLKKKNTDSKKVKLFRIKIETNKPKGQKDEKKNKDNIMKAALKAPFRQFVKLVNKYGGIKLKNINLKNVFGGVKRNKKVIYLKLYQIICCDEKGENKSILKKAKPKNKNKKIFKYLLSREYIFLLKKYNEEEPKFEIDGKEEKIPGFETIDRVLEKIYNSKQEDTNKEKISEVKNMTSNILNNFEGLKERNPNKKRGLGLDVKAEYIKDFEEDQKNNINSSINEDKNEEKGNISSSNLISICFPFEEVSNRPNEKKEDKNLLEDEINTKIEPKNDNNNKNIFDIQNLINKENIIGKLPFTYFESFHANIQKLNNLDDFEIENSSLNDLIERQYDYDNENIEEEEEIFKINNSNALNNSFDFNYNQQFDGMKLESSDEKPPKDFFKFFKKFFND